MTWVLQPKRAQKFFNHQTTHWTDEKTERGLRRKEAAGSVGLVFDHQPLVLPHLSLCPLFTLFPLLGWGGFQEGDLFSSSLLLRLSFRQAL